MMIAFSGFPRSRRIAKVPEPHSQRRKTHPIYCLEQSRTVSGAVDSRCSCRTARHLIGLVVRTFMVGMLISLLSANLSAQAAERRVRYAVSCPACTVELQPVARLESNSRVELDNTASLAQDSKGRYYAAAAGRTQIAVFDSLGRYLLSFGGSGNGPGEFASVKRLLN
jgi:hypothetical protein